MKCCDMTADQIRHLALRLTDSGKMPLAKMDPAKALATGNFYAWVARAEACRKYWRAAKKDLQDRTNGVKPNSDRYHGPFGRVQIGAKMFSLFPASGMLVRDDFASWAEAHWNDYLRMDGTERDSTRAVHQQDVTIDPRMHMWKEIKRRIDDLPASTGMYHESAWLTEFEMRHSLMTFSGAIEDFARHGVFYPILKCDADFLAAKIAYRQRKYAACKNHFMNLAAAAMKAALYVQEHHSVQEGGAE